MNKKIFIRNYKYKFICKMIFRNAKKYFNSNMYCVVHIQHFNHKKILSCLKQRNMTQYYIQRHHFVILFLIIKKENS